MYYFIVNEYGGSGSVRRNWYGISKFLNENDVEYKAYKTEKPGHANKLAKRICEISPEEDNDKTIVVVGGDGTINEVINGISDFENVKVGVIPLGSANDFAGGIGISKDPKKALQGILDAKDYINVDLGRATFKDGSQKIFAISSGIGMDADVCKRVNGSNLKKILNHIHLGDTSYIIHTVGAVFTMKQNNLELEIDGEKIEFGKLIYLASMNMPMEGGGVKMAPRSSYTDGMLTMVCAHDRNIVQAIPELIRLLRGKHENSTAFTIKDFKKLKIKSQSPMVFHTDGEVGDDVTEVAVECLPGVLRFVM